jgi:hypothetical protein
VENLNVTERWAAFQQKKDESIIVHKKELFIVIYGAYNPPKDDTHLGEKDRLIKLKKYLIDDGYINTCLVEDIPDISSPSPNLDKSLGALQAADLNILVFTCRGSNDSVAFELKHAIDNKLLHKCRVYEEVHNGITAMGRLPKENLNAERYHVTQVERQNDDDLQEHVSGDVLAFLHTFIR